MFRRLLVLAAAVFAVLATPTTSEAQVSRADSAQVLLESAHQLQAAGRARAAEDVLRLIIQQYGDTEAGAVARAELNPAIRIGEAGGGRTGFIVSNTLYGAFLGLTIPAALGANEDAYGLGLLLGAPVGFFASKAYANKTRITPGQAGVASFATWWGGWQGLGWQQALNIGDGAEQCYNYDFGEYCDRDESDTAPAVAMVVGSAAGLVIGLMAAKGPVAEGTSSLITNSSLWGTFYGLAIAGLVQPEDSDDDVLVPMLIAGNLGLIAAIPAAKAWNPRASRIRLISAAGLAGGIAGLGMDLLVQPESDRVALLIPTLGATAGLIAGTLLSTDPTTALGSYDRGPIQTSVVALGEKTRFGIPLPTLASVEARDSRGRSSRKIGLQLNLISGNF